MNQRGGIEPQPVPLNGWAQEFIGPGEFREFDLVVPTSGWAAVTLCWDRVVEHSGGIDYTYGDSFFPYADPYDRMPDLDLYITTLDGLIIASSISSLQSEEHIFEELEADIFYKVVVHYAGGWQGQAGFGLAWWFDSNRLPGDYNDDGAVDTQDYNKWRSDFGEMPIAGTEADGNRDGVVDAADYVIWRKNATAGSGAAVPEPSSFLLLVFGLMFVSRVGRF